MTRLRATLVWLRDHAIALLGAIAGVLVFVVTLGHVHRRWKSRADREADRATVEEARRKISDLRAERARYEGREGIYADQVHAIDEQLRANAETMRAKADETASMDDVQLMETLRKLGYALPFAVLLGAAPAIAQDLPPPLDLSAFEGQCAPEVPEELRRAPMLRLDVAGLWFHRDVGLCMVGRLTRLPVLVDRVRLLEHRLRLTNELETALRAQATLSGQMAAQAEGALEAAVRGRRRAEERLDHWTRSPWLWMAIGVVATVGIEAASVAVLREVSR